MRFLAGFAHPFRTRSCTRITHHTSDDDYIPYSTTVHKCSWHQPCLILSARCCSAGLDKSKVRCVLLCTLSSFHFKPIRRGTILSNWIHFPCDFRSILFCECMLYVACVFVRCVSEQTRTHNCDGSLRQNCLLNRLQRCRICCPMRMAGEGFCSRWREREILQNVHWLTHLIRIRNLPSRFYKSETLVSFDRFWTRNQTKHNDERQNAKFEYPFPCQI